MESKIEEKSNRPNEVTVVPVVYPIEKLIEMKGWDEFWDRFEESWNAKSGIGEQYGELVDTGIKAHLPVEVTIKISVTYRKVEE